MVAPQATCTTA